MTEQTGGVVLERRGLNFGPWLTYARALLEQSADQLVSGDTLPAERCDFYVKLTAGTPCVGVLGEADEIELNHNALAVLGDTVTSKSVDLLLADDACIDLEFDVPPGLLSEVRQMIDAEIVYRSPFAEGSALAVWEAFEAPSGGWDVKAALTMKEPVEALLKGLEAQGITVSSVVRETSGETLRTVPPWRAETKARRAAPWAVFRSLSPVLQAGLAGATVFAISATLLWGQSLVRDWSLSDDAAQARVDLRANASASSRLGSLDASLAMSTEVLAVTGTMSELLPDGVWLDQLIIDGDEVTLVGFGPSAAEITRVLSSLPTLTDIRFASPVIRDNSQSIERFRIAAKLVGGGVQ